MPGKRQSNAHKFTEANHQPRHKAQLRIEGAQDRQAFYDTLTPQQKLNKLNAKLGVGMGAVRERARLQALLDEENAGGSASQVKKP